MPSSPFPIPPEQDAINDSNTPPTSPPTGESPPIRSSKPPVVQHRKSASDSEEVNSVMVTAEADTSETQRNRLLPETPPKRTEAPPTRSERSNRQSQEIVEFVEEPPPIRGDDTQQPEQSPDIVDERSRLVWLWHSFCGAVHWCFGFASLIVVLAVLAMVPVLQLLSLGYMLEASGRIARTGQIRDGLIGVRTVAHLGGIVAGTWLVLQPLYYLSGLWYAAHLIDSNSGATVGLRVGQLILTVLVVGHIVAAWYCGGRFRHFFWPLIAPFQLFIWFARLLASSPVFRPVFDNTLGLISPRLVQDICDWKHLTDWFVPAILFKGLVTGRLYTNARDAVWDYVMNLRLPFYFWLGVRGFVGALAWLVVPVTLLIAATTLPAGRDGGATPFTVLAGFYGAYLMVVVALHLPIMQAHFAAENRFAAMFEIKEVYRTYWWRAPIAIWVSLFVTFLFAIPLYLLSIEVPPAQLTWIPNLAFVLFIFPARLITGWAVGLARRRSAEVDETKAAPNSTPVWLWVLWIVFLPFPPMFLATLIVGAIHFVKRCRTETANLSGFWSRISFGFRCVSRIGVLPATVPVAAVYVLFVFVSQYTSWAGVWSMFQQHAFMLPTPFLGL